jgi:two-component system phosphate regulon sensor histidine kinase PhoR
MHMCILLQSYSDFANIDGPDFRLNIEKVNISDAVQGVMGMYHEYAESKDITVDQVFAEGCLGVDFRSWPTDKIRFQIIISTMLHNAIKYCPEGGRVKIRLDSQGDVLYINLQDNGIGINDADLLTLGEILNNHLLKSSTTNSSGTCLGLKLCSSLLRYMAPKNNSKLKFDTVFGKGCNIGFC